MSETAVFQRLPMLVVVLVVAILGVEAVLQLGVRGLIGGPTAVGWRVEAITTVGFSDPLFEHMRTTGQYPAAWLARFVTYPIVHHGAAHALFGGVLLLALGKAVSERFSTLAMVAILVFGTVAGALAYGLFQDGRMMLIGVYPAVYGLLGAFTWALYMQERGRARLMAFRLVGLLVALQLVFRLLFGGDNEWIADLGGFAVGFLLSFVVAPDGAARLRRWRERFKER